MTGSAGRTVWWVLLASLAALGAWVLFAPRDEPRVDARRAAQRTPPSLVGTLALSQSLGDVESAFGSVWIEDRTGTRLLRVDPRRGRVVAAIPLRDRASVATGAGSVWVLERGRGVGAARMGPLVRIDPSTNRVVARVALRSRAGGAVEAFGVIADRAGVWIWGPRELLRVDRGSARVDRRVTVSAGAEVTGAIARRGRLVLVTADGRLLHRDLRTGAPLHAVSLRLYVGGLSAGAGDAVLLSDRGAIASVDANTGRRSWRRRLGYRIAGTTIEDGVLWVQASPPRRPYDLLLGLDPRTGRELTRATLDQLGTVAMAEVGGRLWLTSVAGRVVVVDP